MQTDGFLDQVAQPLDEIPLRPAVLGLEMWLPVAFDAEGPARRGDQDVPGLELPNPRDDALRRWRAQKGEEPADRIPVQVARDLVQLEQRLELGSEDESTSHVGVIQRLDPQAVSGQEQQAATLVPQREGEHAAELLHATRAVFLVEMGDRLGIGGRVEGVAAGLELRPQLLEVVDLAVEHDPDRAVLVPDGLPPGLEVDDPEAAHAEADARAEVEAVLVRATMRDGRAHGAQLVHGDRTPVETYRTGDTAHRALTSTLQPPAVTGRRGLARPAESSSARLNSPANPPASTRRSKPATTRGSGPGPGRPFRQSR